MKSLDHHPRHITVISRTAEGALPGTHSSARAEVSFADMLPPALAVVEDAGGLHRPLRLWSAPPGSLTAGDLPPRHATAPATLDDAQRAILQALVANDSPQGTLQRKRALISVRWFASSFGRCLVRRLSLHSGYGAGPGSA
jgi:hypothetical protein